MLPSGTLARLIAVEDDTPPATFFAIDAPTFRDAMLSRKLPHGASQHSAWVTPRTEKT